MSKTILGIDWGEKKVGMAWATSSIAQPLAVVTADPKGNFLKKISDLILDKDPDFIVVGVSEGASGQKASRFATLLEKATNIEVVTWDETLTTFDAQQLSRSAGMSKIKQRKLEDAYAATVMLQSFIDN
jgi:putative holliday junction resolvase